MQIINSLAEIIKEILPYVFSVLSFFYVFSSTSKHIRILSSMHVCESMSECCADLGYVINLSGKKGIGKTTTGAAITNYLIQYVQGKMSSDMDNIRKSLPEVDFYILEKIYSENLENNELHHPKAVELTLQEYEFQTFYTDNFHIYDKKKMLEDYLKRYYILNIRQEYVLSKTYFFDCVNMENARQLDPTSLELKNVLVQKNYQMGLATVIFEDEKQLGGGNVNSNNKQMKTSGKKEQRALIRNAYEGLCFEVTTKQYDADEMKLERKQIDASINIRSRREINYDLSIIKMFRVPGKNKQKTRWKEDPEYLKFLNGINEIKLFHAPKSKSNFDTSKAWFERSCTLFLTQVFMVYGREKFERYIKYLITDRADDMQENDFNMIINACESENRIFDRQKAYQEISAMKKEFNRYEFDKSLTWTEETEEELRKRKEEETKEENS